MSRRLGLPASYDLNTIWKYCQFLYSHPNRSSILGPFDPEYHAGNQDSSHEHAQVMAPARKCHGTECAHRNKEVSHPTFCCTNHPKMSKPHLPAASSVEECANRFLCSFEVTPCSVAKERHCPSFGYVLPSVNVCRGFPADSVPQWCQTGYCHPAINAERGAYARENPAAVSGKSNTHEDCLPGWLVNSPLANSVPYLPTECAAPAQYAVNGLVSYNRTLQGHKLSLTPGTPTLQYSPIPGSSLAAGSAPMPTCQRNQLTNPTVFSMLDSPVSSPDSSLPSPAKDDEAEKLLVMMKHSFGKLAAIASWSVCRESKQPHPLLLSSESS